MSFLESERVRDLLERAGLSGLSPGALKVVLIAAVALVAVGVWRFWPAAPGPEVAFKKTGEQNAAAPRRSAVGAGAASAETTAPSQVVVHVAGAVIHPGVYSLPCGSRVTDGINAAGGGCGNAKLDSLNLARILADGEQVYVPSVAEVEAGKTGGAAGGSGSGGATSGRGGSTFASGRININSASATELDALPGVGPSTAQKIVDDREANGPFAKPEDLMRVPGIGPKKFDAMKDLVSCG